MNEITSRMVNMISPIGYSFSSTNKEDHNYDSEVRNLNKVEPIKEIAVVDIRDLKLAGYSDKDIGYFIDLYA